jgi:hypothetical protein
VKADGYLLLTVPAYQWLFSAHDRLHHHQRRYTAARLKRMARACGWEVCRCGYFNTLLFPLAALKRLLARVLPRLDAADDAALPSPRINRLLQTVFGWERFILPHGFLPAGLSAIMILRPAAPAPDGTRTRHSPGS